MKTLNIAVLSFVMFSGYSTAESTSLNTVKEYMAAGMHTMLREPRNILLMTQSIMMPPLANR